MHPPFDTVPRRGFLKTVAGSGMRWAEGPVYFPAEKAGEPGYVLVSDIPNNRCHSLYAPYVEAHGAV